MQLFAGLRFLFRAAGPQAAAKPWESVCEWGVGQGVHLPDLQLGESDLVLVDGIERDLCDVSRLLPGLDNSLLLFFAEKLEQVAPSV